MIDAAKLKDKERLSKLLLNAEKIVKDAVELENKVLALVENKLKVNNPPD